MNALLLLGAIAIYAAICIWIAILAKRWWMRAGWVVVAVLVPTWDMLAQSAEQADVCNLIGPTFYEPPRSVDGFALRYESLDFARSSVESGKYRFIELAPRGGPNVRVERDADGGLVETSVTELKSQYLIASKVETWRHGTIELTDYIVELSTGKTLFEQKQFMTSPTWAMRLVLGGLARNGYLCERLYGQHINIYSGYLLPMENHQ